MALRLCFEFLERCRARGLAIFEAHGVPHGKALPLLPMLELFRSFFGITDEDPDQIAREKIAGRFLLLDEGLREVLPLVFDLLGVSDPERPSPAMDPESRQRQLAAVVKRVTQMWGRRRQVWPPTPGVPAMDRGEEAEVADLDEAWWEDVLEEAADEFDGMTRRAAVTAGAKDHGLVVEMEQAAVGDGDAMGVVAEIAKDLLRSAEGPLGVNDPALVVEPLAATARGAWLREVVEFPLGQECAQRGKEFSAEELAEGVHVEEESGRGCNPARALAGEAAARDQAVDVGMKLRARVQV